MIRYKIRYEMRYEIRYEPIHEIRYEIRYKIRYKIRWGTKLQGSGGTGLGVAIVPPFKLLYKNPLGKPS